MQSCLKFWIVCMIVGSNVCWVQYVENRNMKFRFQPMYLRNMYGGREYCNLNLWLNNTGSKYYTKNTNFITEDNWLSTIPVDSIRNALGNDWCMMTVYGNLEWGEMAKDEPEIFFFAFRKNVSKENLSKWNKLTEISNHSSRLVLPLYISNS